MSKKLTDTALQSHSRNHCKSNNPANRVILIIIIHRYVFSKKILASNWLYLFSDYKPIICKKKINCKILFYNVTVKIFTKILTGGFKHQIYVVNTYIAGIQMCNGFTY